MCLHDVGILDKVVFVFVFWNTLKYEVKCMNMNPITMVRGMETKKKKKKKKKKCS